MAKYDEEISIDELVRESLTQGECTTLPPHSACVNHDEYHHRGNPPQSTLPPQSAHRRENGGASEVRVDSEPTEDTTNEANDYRESKPLLLVEEEGFTTPVYNMANNERGCFLIFSQEDFEPRLGLKPRKGSEVDAENLRQTALKLGFEYVKVFKDLRKDKILSILSQIGKADHSMYDCFACAVLSHGGEDDTIYVYDDKMQLADFTSAFSGDRSPSLRGKPKLFFVQACRGEKRDTGVPVPFLCTNLIADPSIKEARIPNEADVLIARSTLPGYVSWLNVDDGAWFIRVLCHCLQTYASTEIMQILTKVNYIVAHKFQVAGGDSTSLFKQMPSITTRLTGELYFKPPKTTSSLSPLGG